LSWRNGRQQGSAGCVQLVGGWREYFIFMRKATMSFPRLGNCEDRTALDEGLRPLAVAGEPMKDQRLVESYTCHMRQAMFFGFVFDVEGTLVDSVPQNLRSLQDGLERCGYRLPYQTLQLYSGLDGDQTLQLLTPQASERERKDPERTGCHLRTRLSCQREAVRRRA
jgi:hypothetical protein